MTPELILVAKIIDEVRIGAILSIMLHPMSPFVVTDGAIIFIGVKCSLDSRFLNGAWEQILLLVIH